MKVLARGIYPVCEQENEQHWESIRQHLSTAVVTGMDLRPFRENKNIFCEYSVYEYPDMPKRDRYCQQHDRARRIIVALLGQRTEAVRRRMEKAGFSTALDPDNREY